jgi:hypothetical protein
MSSEDEIFQYVDILRKAIFPKILKSELPTLEIRPAVTHGDIEIFLNGRLHSVYLTHFKKVIQDGALEGHANMIVEHLRGKKYMSSTELTSYDQKALQKEINYVLVNLCDAILSDEEENKIDERIDAMIREEFGLTAQPEEYDGAHYKAINGLLMVELVKCSKKSKKNG